MSSLEISHHTHLADHEVKGIGTEPAPAGPFGRSWVDGLTELLGHRLRRTSPLLGDPYDDGAYLRILLGNLYAVLPFAGLVLGLLAVIQSKGLAVPPSTTLTIVLMGLGVIDAFSGLMAWMVFSLGVVFTGHFFSTHLLSAPVGHQGMLYAYSALFGLALLWFIGGQLPRKMREILIARPDSGFARLYATVADYIVIPFLGVVILGAFPALIPSMTGAASQGLTQVVIQQHLPSAKLVVAGAMLVRVFLERFTYSRYVRLPATVPHERPKHVERFTKVATAALALLLIWETMGTMWQTYVVWLGYVFSDQVASIGERYLKPRLVYRLLPRNLFKIFFSILFAQYATKVLNGVFVSGGQILGWLAIAISVITALLAVLEKAAEKDETATEASWPMWLTRLGGVASVVLLFLFSENVVHIEAKPYTAPHGVATSLSGVVYVADSGNDRVVRIGADGTRSTVGSDLSSPFGVTADPSSAREVVLIADTGHNRVLAVNTQSQAMVAPLRYQISFAAPAVQQHTIGSGYSSPTSVAATTTGNVFVADAGHNRVVLVTKSGVQRTVVSGLANPQAVFVDPFGRLWVTDTGHGKVMRYDLRSNGSISSSTVVASGLAGPQGVATDAAGNVYISNTNRNKVIEIRPDGSRVDVVGDFFTPGAIAVNSSGHAYIDNIASSEISVVTPLYQGSRFSRSASGTGSAVAYAKDGSLYIVSRSAGTLTHVSPKQSIVLARGLHDAQGVAISALGKVYVSQSSIGKIDVLTAGGLRTFCTGLPDVTAIAPDSYGGLVAVSTSKGTLWAIDAQGRSTQLVSKLDHPDGVTFDAFGNIDVALAGHGGLTGAVVRIQPGQAASSVAQGLNAVIGISADRLGNIFYVESGTNRVWENMGPLGTQVVLSGTAQSDVPQALASDAEGNLFILMQHPNAVMHYRLVFQSNPM